MPGISEVSKELRFNGGLNTVDPPSEIADNELTMCDNFFIGDHGQLIKRGGFIKGTTLTSFSSPYTIYGLNYTQGNAIVGAQGSLNSLYKVDYPAVSTPVAITSLPGGEVPFWMLWIKGTMYFGFISTPGVRSMAGSATVMGANIANSTGGYTAVFHKSRIFTTDFGNPGRLSFSDPNAPASWQVTNTIDVGVDEKEHITALVTLGDLLLIFKWNSIWALYVQGTSPADWVLRRISNKLGCINESYGKKCTAVLNNEVYFICPGKGIYKTNGSSFIELSRKIWNFPQGIFVNVPSYFALASYRNYLIFFIYNPNVTYGPKWVMFFYNINNSAWSTWSVPRFVGTTFNDIKVVPNSTSSQSHELILATEGNQLYSLDWQEDPYYYNDLVSLGYSPFTDGFALNTPGTAYTAEFRTKEFMSIPDGFLRSKWTGLEYKAYASPTFSYLRDTAASSGIIPGFNATNRKGYKISGAGRGRSIQLVGSHSASNPFEFNRAVLHLAGKVPILSSGTP